MEGSVVRYARPRSVVQAPVPRRPTLRVFAAAPAPEPALIAASLGYEGRKRLLDLLGAGLLLAALLPAMAIIALLIRLDSPGPILFWQTRIGRYGQRFRMIKFRTMVPDAEARQAALQAAANLEGPVFKLEDDPRVTRVGRLLRRLSFDELPQLWNVLRGEMSLVGPRPLPPAQVDWHDPRFVRRTHVPPGITGLWQVAGRVMHVDYDRWLGMDVHYVEHRDLELDLLILAKTIPAMLAGNGAY